MVMRPSTGLILEGGGMRGIYTAGVLDFFLDQGLIFPNIYAVSAGACHVCSYLSGQKGRACQVAIDYLKDPRYCSFSSLRKTGDLFGAQFCYDEIPNHLNPYNYEGFSAYTGNCYAVLTDCETGKARYYPLKDMHRDIVAVQASSSLPLVSRMVEIEGRLYLDGGVADSIPLEKSIADGNDKNVVIMTRAPEYRKEPMKFAGVFHKVYRDYPALVEAILDRHIRYNHTLDLIEAEKAKGNVFVIQPKQKPKIHRLEKNRKRMLELYNWGYQDAADSFSALKAFLE